MASNQRSASVEDALGAGPMDVLRGRAHLSNITSPPHPFHRTTAMWWKTAHRPLIRGRGEHSWIFFISAWFGSGCSIFSAPRRCMPRSSMASSRRYRRHPRVYIGLILSTNSSRSTLSRACQHCSTSQTTTWQHSRSIPGASIFSAGSQIRMTPKGVTSPSAFPTLDAGPRPSHGYSRRLYHPNEASLCSLTTKRLRSALKC